MIVGYDVHLSTIPEYLMALHFVWKDNVFFPVCRLPVAVVHQPAFVAVHDALLAKTQQQQGLSTRSSFSWGQFYLPSCLPQGWLIG